MKTILLNTEKVVNLLFKKDTLYDHFKLVQTAVLQVWLFDDNIKWLK